MNDKPHCTGLTLVREAGRGGKLRHTHVCGLDVGHDGKCLCSRCSQPFTCYPWKPRRRVPVLSPEKEGL